MQDKTKLNDLIQQAKDNTVKSYESLSLSAIKRLKIGCNTELMKVENEITKLTARRRNLYEYKRELIEAQSAKLEVTVTVKNRKKYIVI